MSNELLTILSEAIGNEKLVNDLYFRLSNAIASDGVYEKGIVLIGGSGCGKSSLLRLISACFSSEVCQLYQPDKSIPVCKILLIDDIDLVNCTSIINAIDCTACDRYYLCTCTSREKLDKRLTQSYRLGSPHIIPALSLERRIEVFNQLVSFVGGNGGIVSSDIAIKLAVATRNNSLCDIMKFSRDVYHSQASMSDLIEALSNSSIDSTTSSRNDGSSLVTLIDTVPDLVNMKKIQNHLLKSMYSPYLNNTTISGLQRPTSGFVVYGASGTGKSALVHWLAGVSKRHFKLVSVSCSDLVHKVVGETEKYISKVFAYARSVGPSLLWLDNLDSILPSRGGDDDYSSGEGGGGARRSQRTSQKTMDRLLSTLLVEIDGLGNFQLHSRGEGKRNQNIFESSSVVVIVTVNRLESIDRSLLRPGRLEEHIALKLPSQRQRTNYLRHLFGEEVSTELLDRLSEVCVDRSYAELKELHQSAEFSCFKEGMKGPENAGGGVEVKKKLINQWISQKIAAT